ncbi:hypothetical protein MKW92_029366 [Papaver armeniacum]|nr:hypothetical protein MKW92_029366 [Papaver armeniacum]
MWRRACSLSKPWRSAKSQSPRAVFNFVSTTSKTTRPFCSYFLSSQATTSGSVSSIVKKTVKAVRRIATGHKRKETESDLKRMYSCSFGTKESPAIIESALDKLLVGCQGGKGKDKHDVKWIWLEKDKPLECPVCTQYFKLQVVVLVPGIGGSPDDAGKKKTGIYEFTIYLVMLFIIYYLLDSLIIDGDS